jgi:uncharacterized protein with von Willebrand factor type A (vWA) domain
MATFEYSKWDGSQEGAGFSEADQAFDQLSEYLLNHGEAILRQLDRFDEEDMPDLLKKLQQEGLVERDGEGRWRVAPKGIRRIQEGAIGELFQTLRRDSLGKHETTDRGGGAAMLEETRPYVYGDSLANLNLHETLHNAISRGGRTLPIRPEPDDFVIHETEFQASCATVVLIDMSGSMGRYGKYYMTKKVALALQGIVRAQFPQDRLSFVGFSTFASAMNERQLLESAPQPVTLYDSKVHIRYDLDRLPAKPHRHFTNIHAGLKLARDILRRTGAGNQQVIIVTDGEPTAHLEGRDVVLIYPPAERTAERTLEEARRCAAAGIRVSSFALIEDYYYLGLVNFVQEMSRVTRGLLFNRRSRARRPRELCRRPPISPLESVIRHV